MTFKLPQLPTRRLPLSFPNYTNNIYLLVVRIMVFLFVVGVSFSIGFFISAPVGIYVGGGMVLVFMYLTLKRQPVLGYLGLIFINFFVAAPSFFGPLVYFPLIFFGVGALAVFWFIEMFLIDRRIVLNPERAIYASIALALVAVLAFIAGFLPWLPVSGAETLSQLTGVGIFVITSLAFLVGAHEFKTERHMQIIVFAYLALGSLLVFAAFLPNIGFQIVNSLFLGGAKGSMFWNWIAAMAFGQALVNTRLKWRWRLLLLIEVAALVFVTGYITRSWVSGWLPALVALGVIAWVYFRRLRIMMIFLAVVAAIIFFQSDFWNRLVFENSYSLLTRNATFSILYEIVKVNPILGLGPSNYYWYTPLYSILGWYVQFNSHNQYVDLIAQTGLLGLLVFLWLCFEVFIYTWRAKSNFPEGFPRAYAYGVLGGMAGLLAAGFLGDWTIPFVYNVGVRGLSSSLMGWLFVGGIYSLGAIVQSSKKPELEEAEPPA